ncbi:hypothetical protein FQA39_LY17033 [Lamprigera yunnana]|nr:hypothetical protein FQA39_LY17033 [Lamprigera yunnana]
MENLVLDLEYERVTVEIGVVGEGLFFFTISMFLGLVYMELDVEQPSPLLDILVRFEKVLHHQEELDPKVSKIRILEGAESEIVHGVFKNKQFRCRNRAPVLDIA